MKIQEYCVGLKGVVEAIHKVTRSLSGNVDSVTIADAVSEVATAIENGGGGGGGGTTDHTKLQNRDSADQHPISAITGLETELNEKADASSTYTKSEVDSSLATKQEKLTAGDNITIENNTISADDEVLVAVYEQTSYTDVKAAIDAHKAIVLDMPANNNQFCITFATYTNGGNALMYAIYKMSDKPTLMTVTVTPQDQWTISHADLQDKLVSGTNIKTVNNVSLLGSGNIDIQGGGGDAFVDVFEDSNVYSVSAGNQTDGTAITFNEAKSDGRVSGYLFTDTPFEMAKQGELEGLQTQLGTLTDLTTTSKTNLVGAINEVNAKSGGIDFEVGVEKPYGTYKDGNTTYPVYSKVIYISALPSTSGITNYPHGVTDIKQVLSMYGICTNGIVMNTPRQTTSDNIGIYQVQKSGNFAIEVGKDRSSIGAYVTMIYAKNN